MAKTAPKTPKTLKVPKAKAITERDLLISLLYDHVGHYLYPTLADFEASFDKVKTDRSDIESWTLTTRAWELYKSSYRDQQLNPSDRKKRVVELFQIIKTGRVRPKPVVGRGLSTKIEKELRQCIDHVSTGDLYRKVISYGILK